ncbi:hypothetical protein EVA_05846 [gut metagenome]|uniref:Uncharacterized protein n=1 Tax=gut metagenome TaxID=749906 RepID=J9GGI6_9ZZZZ
MDLQPKLALIFIPSDDLLKSWVFHNTETVLYHPPSAIGL